MNIEDTSTPDFKSFVTQYKKFFWMGGIALVVIIVLWYFFGYAVSQRNEGEQQEQDLTALYSQSMISLSTCLDQGQVAAQVTQQEYESIKNVLVGAVSARYVDANGKSTNASGALGGGQLISALQEQYPQIDQRSWQNLQTLVIGCRDEFQGKQDHVQAYAASYNRWRVSNSAFNSWIKSSFPSDELKVTTATGDTLYGRSAYDRIVRVVAVQEAIKAFETGTLDEQNLFGK
ncbi:MAG: hypothetical protein ACOH18_02830 [Candidatus Saccharimonadaceae bacterium]